MTRLSEMLKESIDQPTNEVCAGYLKPPCQFCCSLRQPPRSEERLDTGRAQDGLIEINNSVTERALRGATAGRRGERAGAICWLIGTTKLNGFYPEASPRHVLTCIADHPVNRVDFLLPCSAKLAQAPGTPLPSSAITSPGNAMANSRRC